MQLKRFVVATHAKKGLKNMVKVQAKLKQDLPGGKRVVYTTKDTDEGK